MSLSRRKNSDKIKNLELRIQELEEQLASYQDDHKIIHNHFNSSVLNLLESAFFTYDFKEKQFTGTHALDMLLESIVKTTPIKLDVLLDRVHPEESSSFRELFEEPKNLKKKHQLQVRLVPEKAETRDLPVFLIKAEYKTDPHGKVTLVCVLRNITRESRQLRDLQRSLERAEESDRIKTLFLLNISHNIRTPMNSILGFAELLSLTDPGPDRRKDYISVIKKQSKSLLQLIDDVAEIAKYESGSMTITRAPVNLNLLLNEIHRDVESLRSSVRKEHVDVSISSPSRKGIELFSDSGRLHQILLNLVNHSLKYTIEGSIVLGYDLPADGRISFFVQDTSSNISKEDLKSLFDRTASSPQQSGESRYDDESRLNLSIARSIVKLLSGRIAVEEVPEGGIRFVVNLPYEKPPETTSELQEEDIKIDQQYKWGNRVILIVEDEEVNGLFLEAVFHETGAQTLYAKNGHQAVELAKSMQGKIDLILMDIKMPVMNGIKATGEIRKFNQQVPIIAQTALAMEEDRQQCLLAGCNDTITKPIEVDELLLMVNRYLN